MTEHKQEPAFDLDEATDNLVHAAAGGFLDQATEALMGGANINGGTPVIRTKWEYESKTLGRATKKVLRAPLIGAVLGRHELMAALLLEHHPSFSIEGSVNDSAWTDPKVVEALINGPIKILIRLLEAGLDPNIQDPQGRTLLHHAVQSSETPSTAAKIARALLKYHVDLSLRSKDDQTAEELGEAYIAIRDSKRMVGGYSLIRSAENAQEVVPILRAARERDVLRQCASQQNDETPASPSPQSTPQRRRVI